MRQHQSVRTEETEGRVAGSQTDMDERKLKRDGQYLKTSLSKHLRNSCGSESGKGEKKHTVVLSTRTLKHCMRNQARHIGENILSEILICLLLKSL